MVAPSATDEVVPGATTSWSVSEMPLDFSTSPTLSSNVRIFSVLPSIERVTVLVIAA